MAKKPAAPTSREVLRNYRDRICRLEEEKKSLGADIKDIYAEAKSAGFDVKALRKVVKDSMMDQTQRAAQRETEAITDVYRASLGMLDGTPLGDAARFRFEHPPAPPEDEPKPAASPPGTAAAPSAEEPPPPSEPATPEETVEDARTAGIQAFLDGVRITENPYLAADPRRAAWDEGWCEEAGSDGMDLPPAWRRSEPKKPGGGADARPA